MVKNPPANAGDVCSIPGLERSPGEGNANLLQYSCLGNPIDRGAWQATVHEAAKESDRAEQQQQQSLTLTLVWNVGDLPASVCLLLKETGGGGWEPVVWKHRTHMFLQKESAWFPHCL